MNDCNMIDCRFCVDGKCTATDTKARQGRSDDLSTKQSLVETSLKIPKSESPAN